MKNNTMLSKVFGWMFIGLLLTFITAYYLASNEYTFYKIFSGGTYFILALIEIGLVIFLSARVQKMQPTTAKIVFMLYSIVSGLTFSSIFIVYELSSIIILFLAAAILFGIFACIGNFTKLDLSRFGTYLLMALVALVICIIINLFLGNSTFDIVINFVCLLVFIGFTAYDIQKIKRLYGSSDNENVAILGALELYLDFINIFISLLNLFGKSND